jgi:ATP-dependent Clp protease ATP-binding subunit ClpC
MNDYTLNLKSVRARKARLAARIGRGGEDGLWTLAVLLVAFASYSLWVGLHETRLDFILLAIAAASVMVAAWHRYDLAPLDAIDGKDNQLDAVLAGELLAALRNPITPHAVWKALLEDWQARFIVNHLLFDVSLGNVFAEDAAIMPAVWQRAIKLREDLGAPTIHAGIVFAAMVLSSSEIMQALARQKLVEDDVRQMVSWLERELAEMRRPKKHFGGIGRDWANGFTPTLDRFGEPISRYVEAAGGTVPFAAHEHLLSGVVNNLTQGQSVAVLGQAGAGKSTFVELVAERILESNARALRYYQIVKLNASAIVSAAGGDLEGLMLRLFHEAVNAGNIILFLDDAQMFFGNGVGAFDMSQLLQPILQNRRLKIIAAFTPDDWQALRVRNQALIGNFATITLDELNAEDTRAVVEVAATTLELRNHVLVAYEATREAIRLSGQYMQEDAYPGKAISLLEQSLPYVDQGLLSAKTVQTAIEKMRGLKVAASEAPEANVLLNLESLIHQRMINQTKAVGLVASALRRGRAGVANPKRPVGSFLFLGPTGVGKTELARSLAAVYFGSEKHMIRLDMTEFQSPDDVRRLLAAGSQHERSLLQQIREQPFAVVLLDEIEKAHPNILNLLLQILDEGRLSDDAGHPASFRSAIIITTSNAGAVDIARQIQTAGNLDGFERPLIDKLISQGQFKPELVNRFDEVVLFRPLNEQELAQVAQLMLGEVNQTLSAQNIRVELTPAALALIAKEGYQPEFGARPMRHIIQKTVENAVAVRILQGQATPGTTIRLDVLDLQAPSETAV